VETVSKEKAALHNAKPLFGSSGAPDSARFSAKSIETFGKYGMMEFG
jgi:hypothetical protein